MISRVWDSFPETNAVRGALLHFIADPFIEEEKLSYQYFEDGLLIIENGKIKEAGAYSDLISKIPSNIAVTHYPNGLIVPGFVDTHVHYAQIEMVASFGFQLLDWLEQYAFPIENKFQDKSYSKSIARFFLEQLLRNGTTTAMVFATVHAESVSGFFEEAQKLNMRMIAGKVMMDRFAPDYLLDTAASSYRDSLALIQNWHGKDRLSYAVTPRFAVTSSPEQLQIAGTLKKEFPNLFVQTHLSENKKELEVVAELYPTAKNYLDIYDSFGLVGQKSVFAHGVHLRQEELSRLSESCSSVSFCPTSNLFLGSGLFNLTAAKQKGIQVGIGSDIGGGTSLSILQNLNECYKIQQLQGQTLSGLQAFYLATLGGAKSLLLDDKIGNFTPGKEADFIVLDLESSPLLKFRNERVKNLSERLFMLMMLGDDRTVQATYIQGKALYTQSTLI